ncbi:MAG: hypothetical protein M3P53_00425 [Actinomycetota bacterium]|nr:hypothetical protein [Actinomycetota bacterium]
MTDSTERRLGARYRVDQPDGSWWELGWDRPLATFYAQRYAPVSFDPASGSELLAWHGTDFAELPSVDALARRAAVALPAQVERELAADARAHPNLGPPPFLAAARDLLDALDADDHATATMARHLGTDAWEVERPDGDGAPAASEERAAPPRWSLPAAPLADALRLLHADPALGDDDVATFARGLGLRPDLVGGVLEARVDELGVDEVAEVCQALRCTPAQVWGPALAGELAHRYGPPHWPRHTEALPDAQALRDPPRLDGPGTDGAPLVVLASWYTQTGVIAVGADGQAVGVDDAGAPADPDLDYHFRYGQLAEPVAVGVGIDHERFAQGPLGGVDAEPALVEVARRLRHGAWPSAVDMVRFTLPDSGVEQWLGWEAETQSWQTWDDPRRHYGGDPHDVLDPGGFADARRSTDPQLRLEETLVDSTDPHHDVDGPELASAGPFDL